MGNLIRACFSFNQNRRDSDLDLIPDQDSFESSSPATAEALFVQPNQVDAQPAQQQQQQPPLYYLAPGVGRRVDQLSEEEQIKIAKRIGLISHLPVRLFSEAAEQGKNYECVICMVDYVEGDRLRSLPCTHTYHKDCIDDWLMRSFACPSCNQPVDATLLTTFASSAANH
ncbi:hypothetical protein BOX15_Mlig009217g1 [Macrostomum lignano]|uniref:RING-type domain-containing protein n=1 Tax=Macrostomum lignano TaxID=282301 RepID=A0A267ETB8_9PLAT|nr:hypothetical protein BOX15_Mlig009217g1 [Macrostomum lignano]